MYTTQETAIGFRGVFSLALIGMMVIFATAVFYGGSMKDSAFFTGVAILVLLIVLEPQSSLNWALLAPGCALCAGAFGIDWGGLLVLSLLFAIFVVPAARGARRDAQFSGPRTFVLLFLSMEAAPTWAMHVYREGDVWLAVWTIVMDALLICALWPLCRKKLVTHPKPP